MDKPASAGFKPTALAACISALMLTPFAAAYADVTLTTTHATQILAPMPQGFDGGGVVYTNTYLPYQFIVNTFSTLASNTLPTNPQIAAGNIDIAQSTNKMDITESSQAAVINWGGFNIGQNAEVAFHQPNAQAIVLNRVENGSIEIDGKLSANGQVFLVDANGILFGGTAQVNVGGLVATTLNIADSDFLHGNYQFALAPTGRADVVNNGSIIAADGGYVFLLGNQNITNQGIIQARLGVVELAAGDGGSLVLDKGQLVSFQVNPATVNTLVANHLLIQADGGTVIMTTAAASTLSSAVVSNDGHIEAHSLTTHNGEIELIASGDPSVTQINNIGTLAVSADATQNQNGGLITEQAGSITGNGVLNADGNNGGQINIQASTVSIGDISANGNNGNGGAINLQATGDIHTNSLSANGNNGGTINVQAGHSLSSSTVSANGIQGNGGTINLTAAADNSLGSTDFATSTVTATGTVNGGSVTLRGAQIYLDTDTVDVSGANGGSVSATATDNLTLWNNNIDASGHNGVGGNINLISGGDLQLYSNQMIATGNSYAGNISSHSDTLEYWTNNSLYTAAGSGNETPIRINSENQQYSLLPTPTQTTLNLSDNQQYIIQPSDSILLGNSISVIHNKVTYAWDYSYGIQAASDNLPVNAGVLISAADRLNPLSNKSANASESSDVQPVEILIQGSGMNVGSQSSQ